MPGGRLECGKEGQQLGTHPTGWPENLSELDKAWTQFLGTIRLLGHSLTSLDPLSKLAGLLAGRNDFANRKASLGDRVGWYEEAPMARTLPAVSPDLSSLKQANLGYPRTSEMKMSAWEQGGNVVKKARSLEDTPLYGQKIFGNWRGPGLRSPGPSRYMITSLDPLSTGAGLLAWLQGPHRQHCCFSIYSSRTYYFREVLEYFWMDFKKYIQIQNISLKLDTLLAIT